MLINTKTCCFLPLTSDETLPKNSALKEKSFPPKLISGVLPLYQLKKTPRLVFVENGRAPSRDTDLTWVLWGRRPASRSLGKSPTSGLGSVLWTIHGNYFPQRTAQDPRPHWLSKPHYLVFSSMPRKLLIHTYRTDTLVWKLQQLLSQSGYQRHY